MRRVEPDVASGCRIKLSEGGCKTAQSYWKIGEVAKLTGLTVRTLRFYDQTGLLSPSQYTESGHRLYGEADIARLQQILSLKDLGFSLTEIKRFMEEGTLSVLDVIRQHRHHVKQQARQLQMLESKLAGIQRYLEMQQDVDPDLFFQTMEAMKMAEELHKKYFTEEQLEQLRQRGEMLGEETIRSVEREWPTLIAQVKEEMAKGTPPTDEKVKKLAKRWNELVLMFTGGDTGITKALQRQYDENPDYMAQHGLDRELLEYVQKASQSE